MNLRLNITARREDVVRALVEQGAVLFKGIVSPDDLPILIAAAEELEYYERESNERVKMELAGTDNGVGPLLTSVAGTISRELEFFFGQGTFNTPLNFNTLNAQRYEHGAFGIAPHQDFPENINGVGVLGIKGRGRFSILRRRDPASEACVRLNVEPGDLAFMPAPGFLNMCLRPIHMADNIEGDPYRYIMGLRQQ